jgi:hypothetical protein
MENEVEYTKDVPIEDEKENVFDRTTASLKTADNYQKLKTEFPFDLNNLFSMQYSFDVLK